MVANDIALLTIAGHPFSVEGATGGMLNLRIALRNGALADLARALAKLEGVRVTSGPAIVTRGDCFLVHCPGFKMVLSSPSSAESSSDFAQALLSRAIEPTLAITCELAILFARLMRAPPPQPQPDKPKKTLRSESAETPTTRSSGWAASSSLRRTALQPGKTLIRRTPLGRKTPLGRGKFSKR